AKGALLQPTLVPHASGVAMVFPIFFFFKEPATTDIYTTRHTLSLHDALPISASLAARDSTRHRATGDYAAPTPLDNGQHCGRVADLARHRIAGAGASGTEPFGGARSGAAAAPLRACPTRRVAAHR